MSSSSFVQQQIAKHNKINEEKERSKSPNKLSFSSGAGKNSSQNATNRPKEKVKFLTEQPRPKPKILPRPLFKKDFSQSAKESAICQDCVLSDNEDQKPSKSSPRPLPPLYSPPPPPVTSLESHGKNYSNVSHGESPSFSSLPSSQPTRAPFHPHSQLPLSPDIGTHEGKDSNVGNNKTHPLPSVKSKLPSRPTQRPPPPPLNGPPPRPPKPNFTGRNETDSHINETPSPPNLSPNPARLPSRSPAPPNTPSSALVSTSQTEDKRTLVRNVSEVPPFTETSEIFRRSNRNGANALGNDKPPRPVQPLLPETQTKSKSDADDDADESESDVVSEFKLKEDSSTRSEESGDFSDEYATPDEYEMESEPSGPSSKPYQLSNAEEHENVSQLQLELTYSDEDWDGDWSGDEKDSDEEPEVQIRHKRESHGLVTTTLNDAIAINVSMKYVSGFFDLPMMDETYERNEHENHSTAAELEEGTQKILWKNLPVVKCNPVYKKMNAHKRKLHETIFEIMSTEALYIRLLNTFEDQKSYYPSEEVMSNSDRDMIFSRLLLVKQCAEAFFEELEERWEESIFLNGIFDVIEKHATNNFGVYVKYCTNQARINKMFLKAQTPSGILSPQLKVYQSFLMLPMQRIARLPSLLDSILQEMAVTDIEYPACKSALTAIRKRATECNEDVQSGDRMGGLLELSSHIVFPDNMKPFPLISASRWLKKRSQATLRWRQDVEDDKATGKEDLEMFLFNDVFFICSRRRRDDSYLVQSYCRQSLLEMTPVNGEYLPSLPSRYAMDRPGKYVFVVDILSNQNETREIMVMSMRSQQERDSWLQAAPPPPIPDPSADICYEPWDCPIVVALLPFKAVTPYQLSLEINDKMHVTKRKTIGWYEGERLSDRKTGYFPVNSTMELDSPHKRAREIREKIYQVG